jgi:hypothetical protein
MKPKGDSPHLRYLFAKGDYFKYRRLMKTLSNSVRFDDSDAAKFRLHVIEHHAKFGLQSTLNAFGIKKSILYVWRQKYRQSNHSLTSLIPISTRPKTVRQMTTDYRLIACIKALRKDQGNIGSHLLKPFVDAFALNLGISTISIKTIEKVIKRFKLKFETRGKVRKNLTIKRARNRYAPKVTAPGFIQMDSILVLINTHRYHFMSVIDIYTKFAHVALVDHQQAANAKAVFAHFKRLSPTPIHTVQTDNGSEFLAVFHDYLEEIQIKHVFIYPHSPRINGVVERFNRTIQEEFIDRSDDLYFNLPTFEIKLAKYLSWYNTYRPHAALHYQAPLQFINQIPKSP